MRERCGRRKKTKKGVMVKGSDEGRKRDREQQEKWPGEDFKRGGDVDEGVRQCKVTERERGGGERVLITGALCSF